MSKEKRKSRWLFFGKDKYTYDTIDELVNKSMGLAVGEVVTLNGYYSADDGATHKRVIADTDDGSGVQLRSGKWANIVHNGEVNVSWFGAKGDGVTDDTEAIQKAILYSENILLDKTYKTNSMLEINKKLKLTGKILFSAQNSTAIKITGKYKELSGGGIIECALKENNSTGILIDKMYYSNIKDITVIGFHNGVSTTKTEISGEVSNSVVDNVKTINGVNGFVLNTGFSNEYITYSNCLSLRNTNYGVELYSGNVNWIGGKIEQNRIGIYMEHGENSHHGTFSSANINHNLDYQLYVKGVYYGYNFIGCHFNDNSTSWKGILLEDCRGIDIIGGSIGCDIEYRKTEGVYKVHQGYCNISNNYIVKNVMVLNTGKEMLVLKNNLNGVGNWLYDDSYLQYVYSYNSSNIILNNYLNNLKFGTNLDTRLSNNNGIITCKFNGTLNINGMIFSDNGNNKVTIHRKQKNDEGYTQLYESFATVSKGKAVYPINFAVPIGAESEIIIRYDKSDTTQENIFTNSFYSLSIK